MRSSSGSRPSCRISPQAGNKTRRPEVFLRRTRKENFMSDENATLSRRDALRCLAFGSAGTLFMLSGGVLTPVEVAAAAQPASQAAAGKPLFVQLSDTHIGFHKDANPDVNATLLRAIDLVNAMPAQPAFIIHTG